MSGYPLSSVAKAMTSGQFSKPNVSPSVIETRAVYTALPSAVWLRVLGVFRAACLDKIKEKERGSLTHTCLGTNHSL